MNIIRLPTPQDKKVFIDLSLGLTHFNIEKSKRPWPDDVALENRLQKRRQKATQVFDASFTDDDICVLIAELDGKAIGYAVAYVMDGRYGYLDEMYVDEGARGHGLGKALIEAAEDWAREMSMTQMRLNVFLWNENATRLYEKTGYDGYYLCMRKGID